MDRNYVLIFSVVVIIFVIGIFYLMSYMTPNYITADVKVVANTLDGCIVETQNGFSVNIGLCDAEPNDIISATYDTKIFERIKAMNP